MSKNSVTLTVGECPTDSTMDANLDAWFASATAQQIAEGTGWYQRARIWCAEIAIKYGMTTERVAAIVAVLSPNVEWGYNCMMAEALIINPEATTIDGTRKFSGYPANILKAREIARGGAVIVSGQKVERFYAAILGIDIVATVDSWATRAAVNNLSIDAPGANYDRIAAAYDRFATRHGLEIHDAQAIVWAVIRKHANAGLKGTRHYTAR